MNSQVMVAAKTEALEATLSLVARGNAVLAEIERLSDAIPLLFRHVSQYSKDLSLDVFLQGRG